MESDSQSSNEDNCSSSDSCSDMDVDNTEEHKEQIISKQEQIYRKTFSYYYSHNDQNIIMFLKSTKQGNFHGLKEELGQSLIITRYSENLLKTTEKAKAGLQERLRMSINIFSVRLIKTDHYQPKIFER